MRRILPLLMLVPVVAGCLGGGDDGKDPGSGDEPWSPSPMNETWFLKAGYRLDPTPPGKATPDAVASTPIVNGFANEDLKAFASAPVLGQRNYTHARIIVYYRADGATVDPFPNRTNPQEARGFVFWLGSKGVYPSFASTFGPTILVPNQVYKAEAVIPLPAPSWTVPTQEPLQVLIATLALNAEAYDVRILVDSTATPSRVELVGSTSNLTLPPTLYPVGKEFTILGNSGLFTGATGPAGESRVRTPVPVRANDTYVEVRVVFRSNQGGKSDLDFTLYAPGGTIVAALSTTPYQSETVRLFLPNLARYGAGDYVADVNAYSGVNTRFALQVYYGQAR